MKLTHIYSLLLITIFTFSSIVTKSKKRQFLPKPIIPGQHLININPLAVHLALKLHPKNIGNIYLI